jgi:DNA polymerase-3 subunit beta
MHFAVQKDVLVKALKDVTSAVATRVVQPILSNVLIESVNSTTLKFQATDLDLSIEAKVPGVVYTNGSITLPGKKLLEIVSRLPNELVAFQVNKETMETAVTCHRSKFSMTGLAADDFPKLVDASSVDGVLMPADILRKCINQSAFAAANYDSSSILGGVYLVIENGSVACTATDGSRLAHRKEVLTVTVPAAKKTESDKESESKSEAKAPTATLERPSNLKAIVPAKACMEVVKLLDTFEKGNKGQGSGNEIRISIVSGQIVFETDTHFLATRLISGEYPRYQELFPGEYKYLANLKTDELVSAIERVSVMSDDRTHLIKLHFEGDTVQVTANTPDVGRAQEEVPISFEGQVLDIAVNVRYIQDVLQRLNTDEVRIEMTGPLKPLIIKAVGDECYKYLLMPVQAK